MSWVGILLNWYFLLYSCADKLANYSTQSQCFTWWNSWPSFCRILFFEIDFDFFLTDFVGLLQCSFCILFLTAIKSRDLPFYRQALAYYFFKKNKFWAELRQITSPLRISIFASFKNDLNCILYNNVLKSLDIILSWATGRVVSQFLSNDSIRIYMIKQNNRVYIKNILDTYFYI